MVRAIGQQQGVGRGPTASGLLSRRRVHSTEAAPRPVGLNLGRRACSASETPFRGVRTGTAMSRRVSGVVRVSAAQKAGGRESAFDSIPVLDLARLGDPAQREPFLAELRDTCHTVGFMYVVNHGVPDRVCSSALDMATKFFDLPEPIKMAMHHSKSAAFRGYIAHAAENTGGLPDLREQVEFGVEGEQVTRGSGATGVFPVYQRLKGPNQWPDEEQIPKFRSSMEDYFDGLHNLSVTLMGALLEALDVPADALDRTIGDSPNMQAKIARYPPAAGDAGDVGGFYGVGPHSDSGYLSILLQDQVGGLQVLNSAGEWIDAVPIPGALVVNLGEMVQLASAGYYLATVHRVLPPTGCARISVPYFFNPALEAEVQPLDLPSSVPWQRQRPASLATTGTHGGKNKLLSQYGDNAFKSLARSHPKVLTAHHPDLELVDGLIKPVQANM